MHLKPIDSLKTLVAAGLAVALIGCGEQPGQVAEDGMQATDKPVAEAPVQLPEAADNPFFAEWDTPFGIPPFDRIGDEHYKPAFEEGIEQLRTEVAAIRDNPEPATFENTVEALELAGGLLDKVYGVFGNITNTDTNDALQELEVEIYPRLTAEQDAILLDEKLYQRVRTVYDARESLGLDPEELGELDTRIRGEMEIALKTQELNFFDASRIEARLAELKREQEESETGGRK